MTIKETAKAIADGINARGITASTTEVTKNGIVNYGITVGEGVVRPTFYITEDNKVNNSIDKIIEQYNNLPQLNFDNVIDNFNNFDKIKDKIIPALYMNGDDSLVTRPFLDMVLIYKVKVDDDATITIKKDHLNIWNVTEDEIYNIAIENAKDTFTNTPMSEVLGFPNPNSDFLMNVITNKDNLFGATAMLYPEFFKDIYEKHGTFAILPSSIHEVLVITYENNIEELNAMVKEVNETQVKPEEWLGNHAYLFNGSEVVMDA